MSHVANSIALTVINDGSGSACTYSYERRLRVAKYRPMFQAVDWTMMAARAANNTLEFGTYTTSDIMAAAREIQEYYAEHVKEVDAA